MVEKAVDAEAKAGLQPTSYIRGVDHRCPQGNRPAHTNAAKVQTQGSSMKNSRAEEPKPRPQESETIEFSAEYGDFREGLEGEEEEVAEGQEGKEGFHYPGHRSQRDRYLWRKDSQTRPTEGP